MYHPIAHTFIKSIEANIRRYTKDIFEIQNLQSSEGRAEKFALVSVNTFKNGVLSQVAGLNPNAEIYTSSVISNVLECAQRPEDASISIIFNPIDGFINFTRGFDSFAISAIAYNPNKEFLFSLVYDFKTHTIVYTDYESLALCNGKKIEIVERKRVQNMIIAKNNQNQENTSHYLSTVMTNSFSHDFVNFTLGKIDSIVYKKVKCFYAAPALMIAKIAGCKHFKLKDVSLGNEIDAFINS